MLLKDIKLSNPFRVGMAGDGAPVSLGALRDPGLRYRTPAGVITLMSNPFRGKRHEVPDVSGIAATAETVTGRAGRSLHQEPARTDSRRRRPGDRHRPPRHIHGKAPG